MRIGLTYNLKTDLPLEVANSPDASEEFDEEATIAALEEVLRAEGHEVIRLGAGVQLLQRLPQAGVDLMFNIAEGWQGRSREAQVPALLEMCRIPYTGSDPLTLALTLDKAMAKRVVMSAGLPTPRFMLIKHLEELDRVTLPFPLFVKPNCEGSSKGILQDSKVDTREALERKTSTLLNLYRQPVLVEEYIAGADYTVGILGNRPPRVIGIMRIAPRTAHPADLFYSLEVKRNWRELVDYICPPDSAPGLSQRMATVAVEIFQLLGCRDVARVDFRVDQTGTPFFLEANPLPGLSPISGDLPIMAQKMGKTYSELILGILAAALERWQLAEPVPH